MTGNFFVPRKLRALGRQHERQHESFVVRIK